MNQTGSYTSAVTRRTIRNGVSIWGVPYHTIFTTRLDATHIEPSLCLTHYLCVYFSHYTYSNILCNLTYCILITHLDTTRG